MLVCCCCFITFVKGSFSTRASVDLFVCASLTQFNSNSDSKRYRLRHWRCLGVRRAQQRFVNFAFGPVGLPWDPEGDGWMGWGSLRTTMAQSNSNAFIIFVSQPWSLQQHSRLNVAGTSNKHIRVNDHTSAYLYEKHCVFAETYSSIVNPPFRRATPGKLEYNVSI